MTANIVDFEMALLEATKEIMVALINKGHLILHSGGEPRDDRIKSSTKIIANALREAIEGKEEE